MSEFEVDNTDIVDTVDEFLKTIQKEFEQLADIFNEKINDDGDLYTKISDRLEGLNDISVLKPELESLRNAISGIKIPKQKDIKLDAVIKAIEKNQTSFPSWFKKDAFDKLNKSIVSVRKQLEARTKQNKPEDFIPVRRVRDLGNGVLIFDDVDPSGARGGGGGLGSFKDSDGNSVQVELTGTGSVPVAIVESATEPVYRTLIDEVDADTTYIGYADPGATTDSEAWRIKRIEESANPTDISWADGVSTFTKVWDDRATYDYTPDA